MEEVITKFGLKKSSGQQEEKYRCFLVKIKEKYRILDQDTEIYQHKEENEWFVIYKKNRVRIGTKEYWAMTECETGIKKPTKSSEQFKLVWSRKECGDKDIPYAMDGYENQFICPKHFESRILCECNEVSLQEDLSELVCEDI